MACSSQLKLVALILSNLLLPVAVLVFASGFFPYKPYLPGLATFEDEQEPGFGGYETPEAIFDRVVFMVVDALRSDFVYGYNYGMSLVLGQSPSWQLIQPFKRLPFYHMP